MFSAITMTKGKYILLLAIIALLHSCGDQKNYIIETDLSLLIPDTINGETVAQSRERGARFYEILKSNTVNKTIPPVPVYDLSGQEYNLQDVLSKKTILISSDAHCGFGQGSLREDFPMAMDSLKNQLEDYDIICLVKHTPWDTADSKSFDGLVSDLQEMYDQIYTIEEADAYRINLIANPVRLYINEEQKVEHIASGLSNVEGQVFEIRKYAGRAD